MNANIHTLESCLMNSAVEDLLSKGKKVRPIITIRRHKIILPSGRVHISYMSTATANDLKKKEVEATRC